MPATDAPRDRSPPAAAGTTSIGYGSPLGRIRLDASGRGLSALRFLGADDPDPEPGGSSPVLDAARRWLDDYFGGRRPAPPPLVGGVVPLDPGGTDFQRAVWAALTGVGFGRTLGYRDLARAIGRPSAARAVGAANGRNPLPILVPCHRVVGRDGRMVGFSAGLERKTWLLEHEGALDPLFAPR